MSTPEHYRRLENMMHSAPFIQLTGARVTIREGEAEITLPVRPQFFHAAGAMHGALYFLALDNAAFFAVNSLVEDCFVLTSSFTTYLLRPVTGGVVRASGKVVHRGRTQFIAEAVLWDDRQRQVARASGVFVRSRVPLTPEIGYA
jgi:uncharacterized protein (TIGR00369 family)